MPEKVFVAFVIATGVAWLELVTTKYPRTANLFRKSWALWVYAVTYGLIASGFTWGYVPLTKAGVFQVGAVTPGGKSEPKTGTGAPTGEKKDGPAAPTDPQNRADEPTEPSWVVAVLLGLSAKALLHIRLFSVTSAGTEQAFPIGTESVVMLFEPWLLRTILIHEDTAVRAYLDPKAARYPDLAAVQQKIINAIPSALSQAERTALELDVKSKTNVRAAMELFLRAFGSGAVDRVFP